MKLSPSRLVVPFWLTLFLALLPGFQSVSRAQATETKPEKPVIVSAPAGPDADEETAANAARIDPQTDSSKSTNAPAVETAVIEESNGDKNAEQKVQASAPAASEAPTPAAVPNEKKRRRERSNKDGLRWRHSDNAVVNILSDSTLESGGEADAVVSVFGSSTSAGTVRDAVVSVFGSSTSSGDVGNAVVSVFGNTRVTDGTVGDAAVAVLGNSYVNGHVRGQVVAVLGNIEFGPNAVVDGDVVCVGGEVVRDPKAVLHGHIKNVGIGGQHFSFDWLTAWVSKCLVLGRPLAFGAHLMWAWWIAFAYLAVYAIIALVAPAAVGNCVRTFETYPGKSILAGVLTLLLTPLAYVLLALTVFIVVGAALIPLFTLGLFLAGLFGRVVMLAWLGRRVARLLVTDEKIPTAGTVLIGGGIVLLLYTVPVLGFVVYKTLGILGLGIVIYTLLLSNKNKRIAPIGARAVTPAESAMLADVPPVVDLPAGGSATTVRLLPVISAATLPRAGFWIRVGASLLDVIMVAVLFGVFNGVFSWLFRVSGSFPFWFAVYNVTMWAIKGTTIGGIICGLKVVRVDDRPIGWSVAMVRGLAAFLSLVVAGLGFIWVAFDDDKQSWHDKIAGTTIVHVPKGTSLI